MLASILHILASTADSGDDGGGGSPLGILILIVPMVGLYFLLIRPQQKRMKAERAKAEEVRRNVSEGDEVITTSGIYGIVTAMDDEDVWLEVAEGTEIRIARGAIARITQSVSGPTDEAASDGDGK